MFNSPSTRSRLNTPRYSTAPTPARSRLQTLRVQNNSPTPSVAETIRTERPQGEEKDKVHWSRDERHDIAALGKLPKEVAALVKASDLVNDPIIAHVDYKSGYAVAATSRTCVAWNYAKRTNSTPTTYSFPAPPPTTSSLAGFVPPILAALYTSTAEPGMILVSSSGEIRFWDSLSLALSNVDRYQELFVELPEGDWVERVWKIDGSTFVLTTVTSQAYRLNITTSGGRATPVVVPLSRPSGMFGRASQVLFGTRYDREGVRSVASLGSEVYILASRSVQKWTFASDGQKFVQEYDLYDAAGNAVSDIYISGTVALELDDIVAIGPESLAALVTYAEPESRPTHAILTFSLQRASIPAIDRILTLAYFPTPESRALDIPRLIVPQDSSVAFVRFGGAVVMKALDYETAYEETIHLKDPSNAFLAVDAVLAPNPTAVLLPASGGLMSLTALEPRASPEMLGQKSGATARLESKMQGAVWFGGRGDNPLDFGLVEDARGLGAGDVAEAAESVSAEVVSSSSRYAPVISELRLNLQDKLSRLKELLKFVHANNLLSELPQTTRRKLSGDAEKVKGALELWDYQDKLLDQINSQPSKALLTSSIQTYFTTFPPAILPSSPSYSEFTSDPVRFFFRHNIPHLSTLLSVTFSQYQSAVSQLGPDDVQEKSAWLGEVNQIFIALERAAAQYREEEADLYVIDREKPAVEMWTASDELLDALEFLYASTEAAIKERTRVLGSAIDEPPSSGRGGEDLRKEQILQGMLKRQMGWLAAALCTNMEDKCRVVVRRQMNDGASEEEGIAIKEQWDAMKPRVIRPLVAIDRIAEAFELAEHHRDFPTLVVLSNDPQAAQGRGEARIQIYIERFGEEFAFELYRWYIAQGQAYQLLTQDEIYGSLITRFFETHHHPELAWIHDVACKRYSHAAGALVDVLEGGQEAGEKTQVRELEYRKIVGSIAKLAEMTDISMRGADEEKDHTFQQIGQHLSLIDIQASLLAYFLDLLPSHPRPPNPKHLSKHLAPILTLISTPADTARPSFQALFIDLVNRLVVEGEALSLEDVVDLLVMKDNGDREEDAVDALRLVVLDQTLPKARSEVALISIWRRVYIRDDWMDISNTGGRSEQAQRSYLRQTMIYKVLKSLHSIPDFPTAAIIPPYDATIPPTSTELSARFPNFPPDVIRELEADYETEVGVLVRYVEEGGLEGRVKEVENLVRNDLEAEGREVHDVVLGGDDDVEM
ncbi:hypothetical protein I350_05639 [Cryptococcus amylolentus CBS 6273]|uniref:Nucleoporin Nup133/Nup155-like C-terminal domain-containing protein n=1 Tax=Cryptococcus amylolentus CBS 6273 TaxID=1296118 RepID=A0A1E3JXV5_9TREE|nr:hypothetical protein I350_05639 [Cryptococcus amylolentus CBS 6273]